MRVDDEVRIRHMIEAAEAVTRFLAGRQRQDLDDDQMLCFALMRAIAIIGEAAGRVSPETQNAVTQVPWKEVVGMRNRPVHANFDVDLDILWITAREAVPALLVKLAAIDSQGK